MTHTNGTVGLSNLPLVRLPQLEPLQTEPLFPVVEEREEERGGEKREEKREERGRREREEREGR